MAPQMVQTGPAAMITEPLAPALALAVMQTAASKQIHEAAPVYMAPQVVQTGPAAMITEPLALAPALAVMQPAALEQTAPITGAPVSVTPLVPVAEPVSTLAGEQLLPATTPTAHLPV